jgi:hypothetical protein
MFFFPGTLSCGCLCGDHIFHLTIAFSSSIPAGTHLLLPFPNHFLPIFQPMNEKGIATK